MLHSMNSLVHEGISLPKVYNRSQQLQPMYSPSFQILFDNALQSVSNKHKRLSRHNLKSNSLSHRVKCSSEMRHQTIDTDAHRFILPPMSLLSKILKASRQETLMEKNYNLSDSRVCSSLLREGEVNKRKPLSRKLQMARRPVRRFFKNQKYTKEDKFQLEPWLNADIAGIDDHL